MFTEKRKAMWQILSIGALFCLMGFLFVMPCSAQKAPKGEANIVTDESFMMTGGDCHTGGSSGFLTIVYALHEGLIRRNTDGNVVPALAKSWEMAKNGMSIKFTLNERAKFHNGEPVTANDVKFSYERGMRPELKYVRGGELKRYIDRIQVFQSAFSGILRMAWQHARNRSQGLCRKGGRCGVCQTPDWGGAVQVG
jgi:ABC-type transport system substrate-binding protein